MQVTNLLTRQTIRSSVFKLYQHSHAYAALVLSGEYEEAGDHGRFDVSAGHVVLHQAYEAHLNRFSSSGTVLLNLELPKEASFSAGVLRPENPDYIISIAEKYPEQAAQALLNTSASQKPGPDGLA